MQFNMEVWSSNYHRVQSLGKTLQSSYCDYVGNPPLVNLSKEEQKDIKKQMKFLIIKNRMYLNRCGMYMPRALWKYDKEDKTTWASHESFAYKKQFNDSLLK